ncbi:MAG: tetratricopeptide repeat protein [Syntrophorhabdaceae bacterium]|nr:tetratricopeptide repeat protein [Syntrophorhabdaceae bacterium]
MKRILSLVLLLCLACASYAAAAQGAAHNIPMTAAERTALDQQLVQAASLMEQGKTEEAGEIYGQLLARYPDNDDLALALARAALAVGNPAGALNIYNRLLAKYPDNADLRLETARANHAAGNQAEAARLGGQALAEYEKQRFQIHGAVRAGVLYDSNANQGPASNTLSLGDWDNVRLEGAKRKDSFGAYVGANLDLGYRLSVTGPWWLVGDVQGFWRGNENHALKNINSREWQWGRAAAGFRYLDGKNMIDLRGKAEVFDYEFGTNVTALGGEFRYARVVTPWLHLIADAGLESRIYNESRERNGVFGRAGGYARFFFGDAGHEFTIGAGYVGASADRADYAFDGWQGLARFSFKLPYGFTLSPSASFTQEFYKGPGTALETKKRRDDRLRVGADISYAVTEAWSIEAAYHYTNTYSTCNLYKNDQHVVSLGVAWKF